MDRKLSGQKGFKNSRNRKVGQALKFHNFVANERRSVASGHEQTLTHCLREEHGTKQITVSHWTSSPTCQPVNPPSSQLNTVEESTPVAGLAPSSAPSTSKTQSQSGLKGIKNPRESSGDNRRQKRQSILEGLLAKNLSAAQSGIVSKRETRLVSSKVNKRKPLIIRRVITTNDSMEGNGPKQFHLSVPASSSSPQHILPHKSLSSSQPTSTQDQPLDLSVKKASGITKQKCNANAPFSPVEGNAPFERFHSTHDVAPSVESLITSVERSAAHAASIMASVRGRPFSLPFQNNHDLVMQQQQLLLQYPTTSGMSERDDPNRSKGGTNQRTVIKQKLEDAFRENGFLVKTKQVSDGDATFCKFRQLRKYTRYYLKSWHKHLPDEVNKLYKGFLPPKTTTRPVVPSSPLHQKESTS